MTMIVREMILLDRQLFDSYPRPADEFSDDSGWLGPPRSVPFAWEVAPGTPKHDSLPASPSRASAMKFAGSPQELPRPEAFELAMVPVLGTPETRRQSIHILDNAPRAFLAASRHSEASRELGYHQLMSFRKGSVPFKWEMEPGIPKDPAKCREFLDCPLTPPPAVLHSRSMIVQSSRKSSKHPQVSISEKVRSFFWMQHHHEHRPQQCTRSPGAFIARKTKKLLLLKNESTSSTSSRSSSRKKQSNDSEEEDLSPVSVLDYNSSVRFNADTAPRLSSASSSAQSCYFTPKGSFSWDNNHDLGSRSSSATSRSFRSRASKALSSKRGSFSSLLMQMHHRKKQTGQSGATGTATGCLMLLATGNRSGSFNSAYDEAASDSASSSPSSSNKQQQQQLEPTDEELEQKDEDVTSVYGSPRAEMTSASSSGTLEETDQLQIVQRVDSLETVDPGFAPSELGDFEKDDRILNRMVSLANWQRPQPSGGAGAPHNSNNKKHQFARNLVGVIICCYVPHHRREV